METPEIILRFDTADELRRAYDEHLSNGGIFAPGATGLAERDRCRVVLVHPTTDERLELDAEAVWVVTADACAGVGMALTDHADKRTALAEFVSSDPESEAVAPPSPGEANDDGFLELIPEPPSHDDGIETDSDSAIETKPDADADGGNAKPRRKIGLNAHERLRGISPVQQRNVARDGQVNERIVLERLYGKAVWEALLRNPRLTMPEVARIARMPALPRPLLDIVLGNTTWLRSPQVRRALLTNTRLSGDMATKVLRLTPKHELKLVPAQTAYPTPVREAARKMLK